jgi:hypothetical protein
MSAATLRDQEGGVSGVCCLVRDVGAFRQSELLPTAAEREHATRNALQRSQSALERLAWRLQDRQDVQDLLTRLQQALDALAGLCHPSKRSGFGHDNFSAHPESPRRPD